MEEIISIDDLDTFKVSIRTEKFIELEGIKYKVGETHRRAYSNSLQDRELLQTEVPEPYLSAIMSVWGDSPTVEINLESR